MVGGRWFARKVARALAAALLAGVWNRRAMLRRAAKVLGARTPVAQKRLIADVLAGSTGAYPPSPRRLVEVLIKSPNFEGANVAAVKAWRELPVIPKPPLFAPADRFAALDIPRLVTLGELAVWLGISSAELEWFADERRQQGRTAIPILQHYDYHFMPKASGPPRLIEAPKPRLKAMQRRILHEILGKVPPHPCAFGFVAGQSCLGAARAHAGEAIVIAADLKEFFPSTPMKRVHGIFRSIGYPWAVARALSSLCGTATPEAVFMRLAPERRHDWMTRRLYQTPHLAQGAPTSPALANLAARGLDARLAGLTVACAGRYSRFADDLAFSGDEAFARKAEAVLRHVDVIVREEGYRLNTRKTRIMRRGQCQRLTGLVVNAHVNVPRDNFDALKATLHNCRNNGPSRENRARHPDFRAHLNGRVGWVEQVNPARGARLRDMYDAIEWPDASP
jgi:RNA-directed DNA polymerase